MTAYDVECYCPNCDDPFNGGECLAGFCVECRVFLNDDDALWGATCDKCEKPDSGVTTVIETDDATLDARKMGLTQ